MNYRKILEASFALILTPIICFIIGIILNRYGIEDLGFFICYFFICGVLEGTLILLFIL